MFTSKLNLKSNALQCPYCGFYDKQKWYDIAKGVMSERGLDYYEGFLPELHLSVCSKCHKNVLWLNGRIIYPAVSVAPWPKDCMPINIRDDFLEARNVLTVSPKAASALLRLCLQKLLIHLGRNGRNIELGSVILMKKGSPEKLSDALWAVRAIGPGAIPPGEISPKDHVDTAIALFELINLIVESKITRQTGVNQFYDPLQKRKSVRRRRTQAKIRAKKREIIPTPTILYR